MAAEKSISAIEKECNIKKPSRTALARMGYPKSNYYRLFSSEDAEKNRKDVDQFIEAI